MIYEELRKQYIESTKIDSLLQGTEIAVLTEFLDNWEFIDRFNSEFYGDTLPKTVLCGINPGKHGAGKTGIPFLDFMSLSKIVDGLERRDTERSATFFFDVVQEIGVRDFYHSFYVTNISWVGYLKNGKNLNYYDLPQPVKEFVHDMFKLEMEAIEPTTIISLSQRVRTSVTELFSGTSIDISKQLQHPNWCSFPKNYESCKDDYVRLLSQYVRV